MTSFYNPIVQSDLDIIIDSPIDWSLFHDKSVLITGATGMLAKYIVYTLSYLHEHNDIQVNIIALCRNQDQAELVFKNILGKEYFQLINQDVNQPFCYESRIDYIFHLAGNASPFFINNKPVDILKTNLLGTINILELAKVKKSKVFFASTREVYGKNEKDLLLTEKSYGSIDPLDNRSCYPESKRAAESLFHAYYLEYGIETHIGRIAHSYGPGMKIDNDGRIMSDLIGNIIHGEDIVLRSTGEALRSFCYITDTIRGIFIIVTKGKAGEAYNLANEKEEISIKELASYLASLSHGESKVIFDIQSNNGYCNYKRVALDTSKIEALGWIPEILLVDGIKRTIQSFYL